MKLDVTNMRNNSKNVKNKGCETKKDNEKHCEKKFDKKKYRLQKYSNKYKINQWEERRKKAVLREFYKEVQKDQRNSAQDSLNLSNTSKESEITSKSKKKGYAFYKAKQEYKRKLDEKKTKIEDANRRKEEREEALKKYKEKKIRNFKVLSKKTKKGQPVMKGRVEMLLEKIQQSLA
ncbi:thyroid transcription factor 1-associated protein 26 homolog [Linepithema humile]|uniref:thyroid transcription factor 1-associated protein 26 homolog n=1 Tax=Linepithema humile TaxID=83485 RepID=UPI00062388F0|nr:PREDICTED: thyroid transcription factor 1-associated protein 26 homolog [Linepithema humile]